MPLLRRNCSGADKQRNKFSVTGATDAGPKGPRLLRSHTCSLQVCLGNRKARSSLTAGHAVLLYSLLPGASTLTRGSETVCLSLRDGSLLPVTQDLVRRQSLSLAFLVDAEQGFQKSADYLTAFLLCRQALVQARDSLRAIHLFSYCPGMHACGLPVFYSASLALVLKCKSSSPAFQMKTAGFYRAYQILGANHAVLSLSARPGPHPLPDSGMPPPSSCYCAFWPVPCPRPTMPFLLTSLDQISNSCPLDGVDVLFTALYRSQDLTLVSSLCPWSAPLLTQEESSTE